MSKSIRNRAIMFLALSVIIIFIMAITSSKQGNSLTPDEFYEKISKSEVQLVDIRTPEEYQTGHIENAVNIDFYSDSFADSFGDFNPEKPLYIYCKGGNRSSNAIPILEKKDFKFVYDLKGGINAWKNNGYKIVQETNVSRELSPQSYNTIPAAK